MPGHSLSTRLVVLSIDGMRPDFYRRAQSYDLSIPNIQEMVASGASADAVESVYPSTTYPAHATLVTGVPPRTHGIYSHLASLDPTERARSWHWFAPALRVPALWSAAQATGKRTAAIGWPVSAGAPIDFNIPEIWDPACPDPQKDFSTVARHSTPGVFEEVTKALEPILSNATSDRIRSEAALHLWRNYRPELLLVHFVAYDEQSHRHGPLSPQAFTALEQSDAEVGRIREAVAGDCPVELVVLSDHGFVPVENEAAPLVVLSQEGLFDTDAEGNPHLRKLGGVHAGGSFAVYWLEKPGAEERRALERSLQRLSETGAVAEIVDRDKLESLAADPDAEYMLDAAPGYYFSDRFTGPVVRPTVKDRGTHGQLPTRPGLEAAFIAVGPDIARGKNLGLISLPRISTALMRALGLNTDILASEEDPLDLA
jgi:predicted AlkP superfamily pyrophosphatase or phosphodiesterase